MYVMDSNDKQLVIGFNKGIIDTLMSVDYDTMSIADKDELTVVIANEKGLSFAEVTPDYVLAYHKEKKVLALSQECEEAIIEGFVSSNGHTYRTNRDDQVNMMGQAMALQADPTMTTVDWKAEDVGYYTHTKSEWLTVYTEAFKHKRDQLMKYNALKATAVNATSHQQIINAIW